MGDIQNFINEHLTLENSFVKSIQVEKKNDDSADGVIVPNGYSIRFINCQMKKLTARNSAIHMYDTKITEQLQLSDCIVSIDGGTISGETFMSTNSRINIKTLPASLAEGGKESKATISCSLDFTNTESFWNEVDWSDSGKGTTIVNSRLEFSDCKVNNQSKLEVSGTEWYNLLGSYSFQKEVTIKELEPVQGATDPELAMDYNDNNTTSISINKIRGSAGVGAGCIVHFKGCKSIEFKEDFEVTGSEVNFYDIEDIKGEKDIVTYTDSCGFFSSCKLNGQQRDVVLNGKGNLYFTKCELTSQKTTIDVTGPGANCTISGGKITSQDDCLSINNCMLDIYGIEKMDAQKNCITANNATCLLAGCKELTAKENTFDLTNGAVLDSSQTEKLKGKIIFKGDNSSFIVSGDTQLEAEEKEVDGSGVFVANP